MRLDTDFNRALEALREIYEKHPHPFRGVAGGGSTPKVAIGCAYVRQRYERRDDGVYECLMPMDNSRSMERLQKGLLND